MSSARTTVATPNVAVHWFRKGLRVHDNPALVRACELASTVYPVFIIDPYFVQPGRVGKVRYNFLLESLKDLDHTLRTRFRSRLFVARGNPKDVLPLLVQRWGVTHITFELDTEPYARTRDESLRAHFCTHAPHVRFSGVSGHTLWSPADVIALNHGRPPVSYQSFLSLAGQMPPPQHFDEPATISCNLSEFSDGEFGVPTLEEMGYPPLPSPSYVSKYPGGETEALKRMRHFIDTKRAWVCAFEKPKTSPNSIDPSTTVLSPYLKFGCLSSRLFFRELNSAYEGQRHAQPPVSLLGQLFWREFFYTVSSIDGAVAEGCVSRRKREGS